MLGKVFDRFVEKSPISVMVRGTLERVLGAGQLDAWFARTAQKQYTRTVLFGSSPSLRPGLSPCTIGQYPSFPVVFISQSKGPALNQLDFVVEALSHAVGIALPNVAHNRFKPPA